MKILLFQPPWLLLMGFQTHLGCLLHLFVLWQPDPSAPPLGSEIKPELIAAPDRLQAPEEQQNCLSLFVALFPQVVN